jgi:hypothetical protein
MKILKIEKNLDSKNYLEVSDGKKLWSVKVTMKNWYNKKEIIAYPTSWGSTFVSETIHWFHYVDVNGVRLDREISEQINRWCAIQEFNIEIEK